MSNFRTIQAQAVLFTPDARFRNHRFLRYFLSSEKWGRLFDGEPMSFEPPSEPPFEGFPRVMLRSESGLLRLHASSERLDFFRNVNDETSVDVRGHLGLAVNLFNEYLENMKAATGRVASIVLRASEDETPAWTISRHFCRDERLAGPINRPSEFEIHSLKNYLSASLMEVNSWFRCRSGKIIQSSGPDKIERRAVLVEQDLNTPSLAAKSRVLSETDVRRFF